MLRSLRLLPLPWSLAALAALSLVACSGAGEGSSVAKGKGGGGYNGGGAGGTGGDGTGGAGGLLFDAGGGGSGGGLTDASACAAQATKGQLTPLDLFMMVDQSGSMQGAKWQAVVSGITAFVSDPAADGIGVGIQFFPIEITTGGFLGGTEDSCNIGDYAQAEVPIAPLPGNAATIIQHLGQHQPITSTPTFPALSGAIQYAKNWKVAHADHTVAVVFATDGDPTECPPEDLGSIAGVAQAGFQGAPSVRTYVIGMQGATTSWLDAWAAAGGSGTSFDASDPSKFITALNSIRGQALTCEYLIPTPEAGTLDYNRVNVQYLSGGQTTDLVKVADAASCDPATPSWYYDDAAHPQRIEICDPMCTTIKTASQQAGNDAEIDILLGCATITH